MLHLIQRLTRLRRKLSAQLQGLESGEVKVLILLDGGRSDEDDTRRQIQELRACLRDIDVALHEAGGIQATVAFAACDSSAFGRQSVTATELRVSRSRASVYPETEKSPEWKSLARIR